MVPGRAGGPDPLAARRSTPPLRSLLQGRGRWRLRGAAGAADRGVRQLLARRPPDSPTCRRPTTRGPGSATRAATLQTSGSTTSRRTPEKITTGRVPTSGRCGTAGRSTTPPIGRPHGQPWAYDLDKKTHRQVTQFNEYDVKWPSLAATPWCSRTAATCTSWTCRGRRRPRSRCWSRRQAGHPPRVPQRGALHRGWDLSPSPSAP